MITIIWLDREFLVKSDQVGVLKMNGEARRVGLVVKDDKQVEWAS
jgi:hypothetical protein